MVKVNLSKPKEVVKVKEVRESVDSFTIQRYVEIPGQKIVRAFVPELSRSPIELWSGEEYDKIANTWTDDDAIKKIKKLFKLS